MQLGHMAVSLILKEIAWPSGSGYFWCVSSRKRFVWGPKSLSSISDNAVGGWKGISGVDL